MSDATLYQAAGSTPVLVATIDIITAYDMVRPMLGAIHEPPIANNTGLHRQALRFGSREGTLEMVLGGADAATRADAIDAALKLNGILMLDCEHFPQLHLMRWAVAGEYRITFRPERGRRTWIVSAPIKEVLG